MRKKKNPTSLRRKKKKTGKTTEETYKRDVKLFQLRRLALNKKGTQLSLPKQKKVVEFYFYNFTCLRICSLFLDKTEEPTGVNLANLKIDFLSTF